jgi:hypothetical protein
MRSDFDAATVSKIEKEELLAAYLLLAPWRFKSP